jgi:uncharacterized protein
LILSILLLQQPHCKPPLEVESVPNGRANDIRFAHGGPDNLLDDASQATIDQRLHEVENASTAEVMVVALKSVGDIYVKDFATALFNHWTIGKSTKDNGLLILMVDDQGKISFETGYGLEGFCPTPFACHHSKRHQIPYEGRSLRRVLAQWCQQSCRNP